MMVQGAGRSFPKGPVQVPRGPTREEPPGCEVTFRTHASVSCIPRIVWERMLSGDPESWDFYSAVESVPPPGFELGAIAAHAGDRVVAAAPTFRVAYRLDTPLQGRLRRLGDRLHARWPRLTSLSVIGIGSPMSDNCALGFVPELSQADCARVFDGLLSHLALEARIARMALIVVKGLDRSAESLDGPLLRHGYGRVSGVPLVMLSVPFCNLDHYLNSLPEKTGSYFRRKMRSASQVRIEYRPSVAGLESSLCELFENTLRESRVDYGDFERLRPGYFSKVVHGLGDKAQLMLCWRGEELMSFQLFILGRDRVLAKQIGMRYPDCRALNLYFVNWLKLIEFAIERRIPTVEMGATTYATKLLFGGYLERRWLHFRFRGTIANTILKPAAPLFDFERNDPEVQKLDASVKSNMGPRFSRLGHRR